MIMKYVSIIIIAILLSGCRNRESSLSYEEKTPIVLNDSLMTRMPGTLLVAGDYLVWEDPFARDYFVNVHDARTGKLVGRMGKVGEGPDEFITGGIAASAPGGRLFASDANGRNRGYLSIDSLLAGGEPLRLLSGTEREQRPVGWEVQCGMFIGTTDNEADYFHMTKAGKRTTFGVYPIKKLHRHLGGVMAYDSINGRLAYSCYHAPYLALYKRKGDSFTLQWETAGRANYQLVEGEPVFDQNHGGISDLALCKDYVAVLQRDWSREPLDATMQGRDVRALPHTLFLYDYNSQLRKIIELGMPVVRIAADCRSNCVYAIGVNPEFVLIRYEL